MFQTLRLLSALKGVRHYVVEGFKNQQGTGQRAEGSESAHVDEIRQDDPDGSERAVLRLMSRAEHEMSNPDAVRRREIMTRLKLAAASMRQDAGPPP